MCVLRVGQNREEQVLFSSLEELKELKGSRGSQVRSESGAQLVFNPSQFGILVPDFGGNWTNRYCC